MDRDFPRPIARNTKEYFLEIRWIWSSLVFLKEVAENAINLKSKFIFQLCWFVVWYVTWKSNGFVQLLVLVVV